VRLVSQAASGLCCLRPVLHLVLDRRRLFWPCSSALRSVSAASRLSLQLDLLLLQLGSSVVRAESVSRAQVVRSCSAFDPLFLCAIFFMDFGVDLCTEEAGIILKSPDQNTQ
jgi:hypothetical protein